MGDEQAKRWDAALFAAESANSLEDFF
jgi:hypothetical protein